MTVPVLVRERASRLMRSKATGVPGRGPGARFLIAAFVCAVSELASPRLDTAGFGQGAEEEALARLLVHMAEAAEGTVPRAAAARSRAQAQDDDTRINLELPFQTIVECQRLMRASRTDIKRRESGGAAFLLRLCVRAADALVADQVDTTGLAAGSEDEATARVDLAIRDGLGVSD